MKNKGYLILSVGLAIAIMGFPTGESMTAFNYLFGGLGGAFSGIGIAMITTKSQ